MEAELSSDWKSNDAEIMCWDNKGEQIDMRQKEYSNIDYIDVEGHCSSERVAEVIEWIRKLPRVE